MGKNNSKLKNLEERVRKLEDNQLKILNCMMVQKENNENIWRSINRIIDIMEKNETEKMIRGILKSDYESKN